MKSFHSVAAVCLAGGLLVSGLAFGVRRHAATARPAPEVRVPESGLGLEHPPDSFRTMTGTNATSPAAIATISAAAKTQAHMADAAPSPTTMAPATGGLMVTRDESGTLVPATPQQMRARAGAEPEALSRSTGGLRQIQGPNGAVGVDLQGRFQDYATVTIGRNGKKVFGCVHDDGTKTDSLTTPKPLEEE